MSILTEIAPINLDCYTTDPEELWSLWQAIHFHPRKHAAVLFPNHKPLPVKVTQQLGAYASNKATAMRCRLKGDMLGADIYEIICDQIYMRLPKSVRW
jgi:hypothetical protein